MSLEPLPIVAVIPTLNLLYTSRVEIAAPQLFGPTPHGERRVIPITGGAFAGPRLSGRVLPGGADWQILRSDGIAEVEARYTLETNDGALIYISNWGYRHGPPEVMARLGAGAEVDPREYYFRTTPRFETAAAGYAWLNGLIAVATGERRADAVIITVYEVA
jgi:Protein of unknown function (DUF3237)